MSKNKKQRVLVVGGGFGGVKAALELSGDERFEVTLLSESDELRYYPTLYHTATGGQRSNSSIPLRFLFSNKPVVQVKGRAVSLDRAKKVVITEDKQEYGYDILILALGVVTNYFGIPGLSDFSFSIKSQDEVERFKKHLHDQLTSDHQPDLNYVIVGAGPTGIELAGALGPYLYHIMKNHGLKKRVIHIDLIEAAPRLLPRLPRDVSSSVKRRLKRLGIKVYTGSVVQGETANSLQVNGKPITSHSVVWTAGVSNNPFFAENKFALMNRGKVAVDVFLQAEDNVFVIGDNANTPYSGLAQTALLDGGFVARNLIRRADGQDMVGYNPKKPITVIPAGPQYAAVIWGKMHFYGLSGWILRELADFVGFHDLEPWLKATKQWLSEFTEQDNCQVCALAVNSKK